MCVPCMGDMCILRLSSCCVMSCCACCVMKWPGFMLTADIAFSPFPHVYYWFPWLSFLGEATP